MTELLETLDQVTTINRLMDEAHLAMLTSENEAIDSIRIEYTATMRKIVDELARVNAIFLSGQEPSYSQWKQLQLDVQSARVITENMSTFRQSLINQLGNDLNDMYRLSYNTTSWVLDQTTPFNIEPTYSLPPDQVIGLIFDEPWAGSHFSDRVWKITDEWANTIHNQLKNSVLDGDSVDEMAQSIRRYVGVPDSEKLVTRPRASAQLYRATLIARTELIRAGRLAQTNVYDQNQDILDGDALDNKEWSAKPGFAGVCLECRMKDGKTPREILKMGLDLEEHPNGRCSWIPKVKSWSELLDPAIAQLDSWKD